MSNPTLLFPVKPTVNSEALEFMEEMTERVRRGDLQAAFFVGVSNDGEVTSGFVPAGRLFELIGGAEAAKFRLMVANVEIEKSKTLL